MSITTIAGPTVRGDNTDQSVYTSNAWTPTANALQLMGAVIGRNAGITSAATMTGHGLTWTEILPRCATYGGNTRRIQVWWAIAGASPSSDTVAIDLGSGATHDACVIGGLQLAGFNASSPIVQSATSVHSATTTSGLTVILSALAGAANTVVKFHGGSANGTTFTAGTGFTEQFEGGASDGVRMQGIYQLDATSTTPFSNPSASVVQGAVALEVAVALAAGGGSGIRALVGAGGGLIG